MEELLKAMGIKPTEEMSLDEVRTKIDDYMNFDDSLQELSEALEINTGTYMQLQSIYEDNATEIEKTYNNRWAMDYRHLCRNPQELADILLAIFVHAHAKIGEISFMLENDIGILNDRETEILDRMEQEQIADSDYCQMSDLDCDDCYISECSSSACR